MTNSLELAKREFLALLARVDPAQAGDFMRWVIQQGSGLPSIENNDTTNEYQDMSTEQHHSKEEDILQAIADDLRSQMPLEAVCSSEQICCPSDEKYDLSTTVDVDAFLYDDEMIDDLCEQGRMSRNYCCDCGSHNTKPLTFISHSSSIVQLKYILKFALPKILAREKERTNLEDCLFVDVGSRLGAVLYGAYYFSPIKRIVGVELNNDLCKMQESVVCQRGMQDRVQVRCNDICNEGELLQNADIVMLNNVFEFFMPAEQQRRAWRFLKANITKPGCVIISVPSLHDSVAALSTESKPFIDLASWVQSCRSFESEIDLCTFTEEEAGEFEQISMYRVLKS